MARTSPPLAGYPVFDYPNPPPLLSLPDKGDQIHIRTQSQIDSPTVADVANIEATFILSVAPFTRYITNGTSLVPAAASGAGSGTVTTVSVVPANGISGSVANPSTTPSLTLALGAITPSSVTASGTVTGSNLSGTNTGDQTITLTGDVTGAGSGSFATILASSGVTPATYTHSTITVDAKGRITAASSGTVPTGTVTSVNLTAPAAGITATGGPVTTSGSITLALANDLAAVENLSTTGLVRRTATDTWSAGTAVALASEVSGLLPVSNGGTGTSTPGLVAGSNVTVTGTWPNQTVNSISGGTGTVTSVAAAAPAAGFTVSGGPVTTSGTLTFALADDLAAVEGLASTGIVRRTASNTWSAGTAVGLTSEVTGVLPVANGGTGTSAPGIVAGTNVTVSGTWPNQTVNSTSTGTVTSVNVTAPAAGITTSGGPVTASGSISLALANDLAAVEGLATTGIVRRTATDTWSAGTAVGLTTEVTGVLPRANGGATPSVTTLTDGATISVDASLSDNFRVTLGGNRTLSNPTNLTSGQVLNFRILQDATGSRTLAYGTKFKFAGGTAPVLSTAASAKDFLSCQYDSTDDTLYCVLNKAFA